MAHRPLTLKYRPQVFADMVGQEHVSRVLERALETGRIAHAYLFTGARGVGKTTAARILAKSLNCEKRASGELKGPDPCNACSSCLEITNGVSLDVTEIDGASNRGIADVQALRERVRFTPTGGKHRVVIIDEVHQLSNDAFAALLKTLEEPPPHLVFIFATTDPQKLPDTIRSRTQRYDFARVSFRKVADRLLDIQKREAADPSGVNFSLVEGAALLIAHKSEGSMRDAVGALDHVISSGEADVDEALVRRVLGLADREAFFDIAEAIVRRDPKQALHALHRAFDKGLDPRDLAGGLSEHIRHILILKVDPDGTDLVAAGGEDLKRLRGQGEGWSDQDLLRLLRIASEVLEPMRDSPQPLVHLEAALLQMATLEPGETLAELLARLEALERRLGGEKTTKPPGSQQTGSRETSAAAGSRGAPAPTPSSRSAPPAPPPAAKASPPPPAAPTAAAPPPSVAATVTSGSAIAAAIDTQVDQSGEVATRWRSALQTINGRKRLLGAFLEESVFIGRSGNQVVVAMDDLHRAVVEEKDNRAIVTDELLRAFGETVTLRCEPLEAAGPLPERPSAEATRAMVIKTLEWFGSEAAPGPATGERTNA